MIEKKQNDHATEERIGLQGYPQICKWQTRPTSQNSLWNQKFHPETLELHITGCIRLYNHKSLIHTEIG